jgi:hypothetical protein
MTYFSIDRVQSAATRANKLRGVHVAIVVDNKDGEGNPGYRVKVKFPWLNADDQTYWARIAVPMGGKERGTYFLADPEDQLLVVFEHGDINRPIVIGALWSKKQEPVEFNQSGKNNTKLIKSRSGHRIIFDDKDGAEKLTLVDKTNKNKIVLDSANKLVQIECAGDIEIKAKQNVIFHSNALKVGTSEGITGSSQQFLAHATSTFGLKASGTITISGSQIQTNTSSSAATSVSGSGSGELGDIAGEQAKDQVAEKEKPPGPSASSSSSSSAAAKSAPKSPPPDEEAESETDESSSESDQPAKDNEHVFVVKSQLQSPGGVPLGFEQVVLVKSGTNEVVGGPVTTEADGSFGIVVPEDGSYDIKLLDDETTASPERTPDALVASHLHLQFFDGAAPAAGEMVQVTGGGQTIAVALGPTGELDMAVDAGAYEIKAGGQTFKAHSLNPADLQDGGGGGYHFALTSEVDPEQLGAARADRYSPHQRTDDGEVV